MLVPTCRLRHLFSADPKSYVSFSVGIRLPCIEIFVALESTRPIVVSSIVNPPKYVLGGGITVGLASTHRSVYLMYMRPSTLLYHSRPLGARVGGVSLATV